MLKMKKFFLLAILASAFALITSCGGGAGGSGSGSTTDQLYADGFEFTYKTSMDGTQMSTGTFGGKGTIMWNEMSMMGIFSMKQVIKLSSDGEKATVYTYMNDTLQSTQEVDYDEYMENEDDLSQASSFVESDVDFDSFTKQGTKTVAGKTCDYYVGRDEAAGTEFAYYAAKGMTLYTKTTSQGMVVEMEITSIIFGNEVTVPSLPN